MILHKVRLYETEGLWDILIEGAEIKGIRNSGEPGFSEGPVIDCKEALALPGFINSHEHLDFNLFPQLGGRVYRNYREWGPEIQQNHKELIDKILKIPLRTRVHWGLYKNLLNGFTTVINHGEKLEVGDDLVSVYQNNYNLHSPGFEKNWKWKLNIPFEKRKIVMHIGEGSDELASSEIDEVIRANFLDKRIVAVHGIGMIQKQAKKLEGLVWCPESNYFLFRKTAEVPELKDVLNVVFGTDSTLTASWSAWDHFTRIMRNNLVEEKTLLDMLSYNPSRLWELDQRGELREKYKADIILIGGRGEIFKRDESDILMVMRDGVIKLLDGDLSPGDSIARGYDEIEIRERKKKVWPGIRILVEEIRKYYPEFDPGYIKV